MKNRHGFGKSVKLRKDFEFKKAREKGVSYRDGVFALTIACNDAGHHRLGLSVGSSKVPLSSRRNRIKRLVREVFRINRTALKGGPYDMVVSVRQRPDRNVAYSTVEKNLLTLLKKAKAL